MLRIIDDHMKLDTPNANNRNIIDKTEIYTAGYLYMGRRFTSTCTTSYTYHLIPYEI